MPSVSSLFLLFLYFRKFTSENILGTGRKFTGNFYSAEGTRTPKGSPGGHPQARAACCRGLGSTRGWDPPLPVGHPLGPSDAYKFTLNLITSRRPLFFREVTPTRRHLKPYFGGDSKADPGTLPEIGRAHV